MCELLEIPTPFRLQDSRVLLLEPAGSCAPELGKRLREGTYDESLIGSSDVYFEAGDHVALVHVTGEDFLRLMANAPWGEISHHVTS